MATRASILGLTLACVAAGVVAGFVAEPEQGSSAPGLAPLAVVPAAQESARPADPAHPAPAGDRRTSAGRTASPAPDAPALDSPKQSINYALAANGAVAAGSQNPQLLIDGNHTKYDGANGYAQTEWNATPPQAFTVTFKEPSPTNAIRFLLWDQDNRFYRYKLDVCPDEDDAKWKTVADLSGDKCECRGWQVALFQTQTVRRVRLTGTFGSANSGFHVVELEAYDAPAGLSKPWEDVDF